MHSERFLCQVVLFDRVKAMVKLRVKEVADSKGISMSKLSRMSDVSYNTILALFHNPQHDVSILVLDRLAQALQVSICDLLEESRDK